MKTYLKYKDHIIDMVVFTVSVTRNQLIIFHDEYKLLVDSSELHWDQQEVTTVIHVSPANEDTENYLKTIISWKS